MAMPLPSPNPATDLKGSAALSWPRHLGTAPCSPSAPSSATCLLTHGGHGQVLPPRLILLVWLAGGC